MRPVITAVALALGLAFGAPAPAHGLRINHDSCGFTTDYDVRVDAGGVAFDRAESTPSHVFMHDGRLRVDGRDLAVSAADAARLRQYESQVRALLPEVAGIAREGVDIGFAAMSTVAATFADDEASRRRVVEQLDQRRQQALAQIDRGLGRGVWKPHDLDSLVKESVGDSVSSLVSTVTASAVKAALSGDQAQVKALQARADALDRRIDKEVNARADRLQARAEALCPRLTALEQLQQQWQVRLHDGSPLQLMERDDASSASARKPEVARR